MYPIVVSRKEQLLKNRGSPNVLTNYRLISILNTDNKILTRVLSAKPSLQGIWCSRPRRSQHGTLGANHATACQRPGRHLYYFDLQKAFGLLAFALPAGSLTFMVVPPGR